MRLAYLDLCGFRGFREQLRIDFAAGFTVISGRNGVGKSTLCDAIEFAVTGKIDKYEVEKAAKETLVDYVWWRGKGKPASQYVTVCFEDKNGVPTRLTRTRGGGANLSPGEIEALLCVGASRPDLPLEQTCRTSIIRDEWIAASSLDLTEAQRFEFVRSSLGAMDGPDYASKGRAVIVALDHELDLAKREYEDARTQVTRTLTDIERERALAFDAGDLAAALAGLGVFDGPTDLSQRIADSRKYIAAGKMRLQSLEGLLARWIELMTSRAETESKASKDKAAALAAALTRCEAAVAQAGEVVAAAARTVQAEEQTDRLASSLAFLVEHGETLGLHDEHCPLCDAARTSREFAAGLETAKARLARMGSGIERARATYGASLEAKLAADRNLRETQDLLSDQASAVQDLEKREAALASEFDQAGVYFAGNDPEAFEKDLASERSRLVDMERHVLTLDASQSVGRLADMEQRLKTLRKDADDAGDRLERTRVALVSAKALERTVKRCSAEVIDERLAVISPLLNELYERLRPHAEWRNIEYAVRGDVKRYLSLKVGDNLNPQFVFSSGQRRAAGLAFLLSVHLSRQWCRWTSLVLDDPVQHIDDFRALHLAEVLGAVRRKGRQVICAVEDVSLADLMCRRMPSTQDEPGRRIDLDLAADGEVVISRQSEIGPETSTVLGQTVPRLSLAAG